MKYIFKRPVEEPLENFENKLEKVFTGNAPWIIQGVEYSTPLEWLQHARKTAIALGIREANVSIEPTKNGARASLLFMFKNNRDLRNFRIATEGDIAGKFRHNFDCLSTEDRNAMMDLAMKFLETNEMRASIHSTGPASFAITANSLMEHFATVSAYEDGIFSPTTIIPSGPTPPSVK